MDRRDFCRRFIRALQELPGAEAEYLSTSERLEVSWDARKDVLHLDEAFAEVAALPPDRQEASLRAWAARLAPPPPPFPRSWNEARPFVVPALASPAGLAFRRRLDDLPDPPNLAGPGALRGLLRFETPSLLRPIRAEHLAAWGLSLEAAWSAALDNLRDRPAAPFRSLDEGLWVSNAGDGHDAARLLAPFPELSLRGAAVVLPVRRDVLLVADEARPEALRRMGALALRDIRQDRRLSGTALRFRDGAWRPWMPPREHPAFPELRWLEAAARHLEYGEQQAFWQADFSEGPVGKVRGVTLDTNERVLGAEWPEGSSGLLCQGDVVIFPRLEAPHNHRPPAIELREPEVEVGDWIRLRSDALAFSDLLPAPKQRPFRVPWAALLEVAGTLLSPVPGSAPPRWRLQGSLSPAQERALAGYAI